MSQGFRPGNACLGFALIALAVQAITPDPHDLTSFSIFRILWSLQAASRPPAAAGPMGQDTGDENGDEVFAPFSAGTLIALQRPTNGPPRLITHAKRNCERSGHAGFLHPSRSCAGIARSSELIFVLCRLIC